jgi:hypothetical protein
VAGTADRIYLDLANEIWQCVEIGPDGWSIVGNPPVRFRRSAGMLPLPAPIGGGSVDSLRSFLNLRADADFVLVAAAGSATRIDGPYPLLVLAAERGSRDPPWRQCSGRWSIRMLLPSVRFRATIVICSSPPATATFLRSTMFRTAPYWLSDTLCRLATGGGFATR